jgi:hypothetical protein
VSVHVYNSLFQFFPNLPSLDIKFYIFLSSILTYQSLSSISLIFAYFSFFCWNNVELTLSLLEFMNEVLVEVVAIGFCLTSPVMGTCVRVVGNLFIYSFMILPVLLL